MRKINDILRQCDVIEVIGDDSRYVSGLAFDSRKCSEGMAFFAIKGTQVDGHDFIDRVIEQGCKTVVCEHIPGILKDDVTYYVVGNTAKTRNECDRCSMSLRRYGLESCLYRIWKS